MKTEAKVLIQRQGRKNKRGQYHYPKQASLGIHMKY